MDLPKASSFTLECLSKIEVEDLLGGSPFIGSPPKPPASRGRCLVNSSTGRLVKRRATPVSFFQPSFYMLTLDCLIYSASPIKRVL